MKIALGKTHRSWAPATARKGMVLTGGGRCCDIDRLPVQEETSCHRRSLADDPLTCVVRRLGPGADKMDISWHAVYQRLTRHRRADLDAPLELRECADF